MIAGAGSYQDLKYVSIRWKTLARIWSRWQESKFQTVSLDLLLIKLRFTLALTIQREVNSFTILIFISRNKIFKGPLCCLFLVALLSKHVLCFANNMK